MRQSHRAVQHHELPILLHRPRKGAPHHSGLMPSGLRQSDGYLWRKQGARDVHYPEGYEKMPCLEEAAYFLVLGSPSVPSPPERQ